MKKQKLDVLLSYASFTFTTLSCIFKSYVVCVVSIYVIMLPSVVIEVLYIYIKNNFKEIWLCDLMP